MLGLAERPSSSAAAAPPVPFAAATAVPSGTALATAVSAGGQQGELGAPAGDLPGGRSVAIGVEDGVLLGGTTVFDDGLPGIAKLDPALLRALRRASTDAQRRGIRIDVDSGWRSRTYQEQLFRQAVSKYGSAAAAARWVAVPGTSAHESGSAVDVGPSAAAAWLSVHGATYGLCQIYSNEPWHYELRPDATVHGCPPVYADPTDDPRLHR